MKFLIRSPEKLVSVNKMYEYWRGKVVLSKDARSFKQWAYRELQNNPYEEITKEDVDAFKGERLKTEFLFALKGNYYKRDLTNLIKLAEDCIFNHIELNDRMVVQNISTKYDLSGSSSEFMLVIITRSDIKPDLRIE